MRTSKKRLRAAAFVVPAVVAFAIGAGAASAATVPTVEAVGATSEETSVVFKAWMTTADTSPTTCKFEYGKTSAYGSSVPCVFPTVSTPGKLVEIATATKLTKATVYHWRIVATNAAGTAVSPDQLVSTKPVAALITSDPATDVTQFSAKIHGAVNPNGKSTTCIIWWSKSANYENGDSAPCDPEPGSGKSPVPVDYTITGLDPQTTYHFKIAALNENGSYSDSEDRTFTTQRRTPEPTTNPATAISSSAATITGTLNTHGFESACALWYGETTQYGQSIACDPNPVPGGFTPLDLSFRVTGLLANKTYHYEIIALNNFGEWDVSPDRTFTTLPR